MPSFSYKNKVIEYTLTRKAKRNVNFRIRTNGDVYISAPRRVSTTELEKLIYARAEWIINNQQKVKNKKQNRMSSDIKNRKSYIFRRSKIPY